MFAKLGIECELVLETGLHIGAVDVFSGIGALDSPVVRDPMTGHPMVPGSSLKGKMRSLLSKAKSESYLGAPLEEEPLELKRLFGSTKYNVGDRKVKSARLQFADSFLLNAPELLARGSLTEAKAENGIDRITAVANPRQIERVVRGARFNMKLTYDLENETELQEDFANIALAMKLLTADYLGGHGSRGSGRVRFENIRVTTLYSTTEEPVKTPENILKDVEAYGV